MPDARVQLVLVVTFLYLAQGFFGDWRSRDFQPPATARLRSVAPGVLVLEADSVRTPQDGQMAPAVHAPFFFQAIPVNSADKEMLMTVKGIGPSLAGAIITYRQRFGPLQDIEDLMKIPGVGSKRAAALAPFLLFDEVL